MDHNRSEITQTKMREKFRIERITRHRGFIQDLMIPRHAANRLAKGEGNARITDHKLFEIGVVGACGDSDRTKQIMSPRQLVVDLEIRTGSSKQSADRLQGLRQAVTIEPACVDRFDCLKEQIVVWHRPSAIVIPRIGHSVRLKKCRRFASRRQTMQAIVMTFARTAR